MRKGLIAVLVAVLVIGGGIAWLTMNKKSDKTASSSSTTPPPSSNDTTSNDNQAVATTEVTIQDMAFSPATITVKKGSTVTWTNKDSVSHNVSADESSDLKMLSDTLADGDSFKFTFDKTGTFTYRCDFHPSMTGTVIVTE
jgi:plastocyanin